MIPVRFLVTLGHFLSVFQAYELWTSDKKALVSKEILTSLQLALRVSFVSFAVHIPSMLMCGKSMITSTWSHNSLQVLLHFLGAMMINWSIAQPLQDMDFSPRIFWKIIIFTVMLPSLIDLGLLIRNTPRNLHKLRLLAHGSFSNRFARQEGNF